MDVPKEENDGFRMVSRKRGKKAHRCLPRNEADSASRTGKLMTGDRGSGRTQLGQIPVISEKQKPELDLVLESGAQINLGAVCKKINDCVLDLQISDFYRKFLESFELLQTKISSEDDSGPSRSQLLVTRSEDDRTFDQGTSSNCDGVDHSPNISSNPDSSYGIHSDQSQSCGTGAFKHIVCYGLGNFSTCVTARFQLALLVLLNSVISPETCCVYDPNFLKEEEQVLQKFGFLVISKNEEGKREAAAQTLFFMPHCGKPLYNNLLWANWGQRLTKVIILGNSFRSFSERFTDKQLHQEVPYIFKVLPYHHEIPVKNIFQFTDIFNDMAFNYFQPKDSTTEPSLWSVNPEPCYDLIDNVEIIQATAKR